MLPKKHRLSKTAEVKHTAARGRSFFNPYFVIKATSGSETAKITVIVSTKVSKKAVTRNRLKRIIREALRVKIDQLAAANYAIIVKPKAVELTAAELREQTLKAFKASNHLK